MATYIDWTKFNALVARALNATSVVDSPVVYWDASMGCSSPYEVDLRSQPPHPSSMYDYEEWLRPYRRSVLQFDENLDPVQRQHFGFKHQMLDNGKTRFLRILRPCRKCPVCLENRRKFWAQRARYEVNRSPRTWFVTLTINPQWRFIFSCRAKSTDYFASYGEISKEVTKFFKRLRKAGHVFKYMMVAEAHKDGYPHIHLLVHEVSQPIPKREIERQWNYGFTKVKLVKNQAAAYYVAKYLAKDMRTRVRASQHYGEELTVGQGLSFRLVEFNDPLGE